MKFFFGFYQSFSENLDVKNFSKLEIIITVVRLCRGTVGVLLIVCRLICKMEELSCAASNFHRSSEYFCFTPVICKTNVPDVVCFLWFSFSFFFAEKL